MRLASIERQRVEEQIVRGSFEAAPCIIYVESMISRGFSGKNSGCRDDNDTISKKQGR